MKTVIDYFLDGKTVRERYQVDDAGRRQGPYEEYWDHGQIRWKCTYKDGKKEGPYEEYDEYGQVIEQGFYKNDKLDGSYKEYYRNGQLYRKCTYKDDKKDGPYESYHENGQLMEKTTYKDDEKDGPYESYYANGQLEEKNTYKNGVMVEDLRKSAKEATKDRNALNERLRGASRTLRKSPMLRPVLRELVGEFRAKHPEKGAGRAPRKGGKDVR